MTQIQLPLFVEQSAQPALSSFQLSQLGSSTILRAHTIPFPSFKNSVTPDEFGNRLRNWYANGDLPRYKVLSLFSGCGGLDLAFHDAGFEVTHMVEKDTSCIQTLNQNSESNKLLAGSAAVCCDVETYEPAPGSAADFIIGGPPCQSFSAAGRRMAGVKGTSSPGGLLFHHYVRLLETLKPKGFLFENVLGLLGAQQGEDWKAMKAAFVSAGYQPFVYVLDAADYGVPQHRERVIVIGVRTGAFRFPAPTHGPKSLVTSPYITAGQALESVPVLLSDSKPESPNGKYGHLLADIPPGLNYAFYTERMGHPRPVFSWRSKFSDFLYKADPDEPSRTLKANGGPYSGPFHWENRPFTLAELKRLQTFPDSFEIAGSRRIAFRQVGNAVPPQLARIMALAVRAQIFEEEVPVTLEYLPSDDKIRLHRPKQAATATYVLKAQAAIKKITSAKLEGISEKEQVRYLTSRFGWQSNEEDKATAFSVRIRSKAEVCTIRLQKYGNVRPTIHYTLILKPTLGFNWPLPATEIRLQATDNTAAMFSACWKAFQEFLSHETGLADVIQLSGYYYFKQQLTISLQAKPSNNQPQWLAIVDQVLAGHGVGKILSACALSEGWGIKQADLIECLTQLSSLGYEVRSHHVNPQIEIGSYLVLYSFPTLTPGSPHRQKLLQGPALQPA